MSIPPLLMHMIASKLHFSAICLIIPELYDALMMLVLSFKPADSYSQCGLKQEKI